MYMYVPIPQPSTSRSVASFRLVDEAGEELAGGDGVACCSDVREIGDVNEGVVERGKDACNTEDELACVSEALSV